MEALRKARAEHNLDRRMRVYMAPKVLIVDEFRIRPYDQESATAFLTLVSARGACPELAEGNVAPSPDFQQKLWGMGGVVGDTVIAPAVLDRLLHHSHVLNIRRESYRLKDKRPAGLFPSQQHLPSRPEAAPAVPAIDGIAEH